MTKLEATATRATSVPLTTAAVYFYSRSRTAPELVVEAAWLQASATDAESPPLETVRFTRHDKGRRRGETCWVARPQVPSSGSWSFRVALRDGSHAAPIHQGSYAFYRTSLKELWVQQGEVYDYAPLEAQMQSRVVKIPYFRGRLPSRTLYVYLPRGYDQQPDRRYPVIYMQDGQNCFETYAGDSFAGTWRADETADRLISAGQMRECLIVGVSNGGSQRIAEYLPPYAVFTPQPKKNHTFRPIHGQADRTVDYYVEDVAPYINRYYRTLTGPEHTATVGSSMGGLFSTYFAWRRPDFAKQHAALSPSFWITANDDEELETIIRMEQKPRRPIRFWLDSGTVDDGFQGDDGMQDVILARDALLRAGYKSGVDFVYFRDEGASHSEAAWAGRLDKVFRFLMPYEEPAGS